MIGATIAVSNGEGPSAARRNVLLGVPWFVVIAVRGPSARHVGIR
jgi:hypothetical protein